MPALQVRDLPQDLYDQLRDRAEREHRSMAQETVVAIESHLQLVPPTRPIASPLARNAYLTEEEERQLRIKKRKALFAEIHELAKTLPPIPDDFPSVVDIIREGREGR